MTASKKRKITADEFFDAGAQHLAAGDRANALAMFQNAVLADPAHAISYNNRGSTLMGLGLPFDALMHFERAAALEPRAAEYRLNVGTAALELGQLERAEAEFRACLALRPRFAMAKVNLGNVVKLRGDVAGARDAYREAVAIDPDYVDAHINLSFAALALGDFAEGWREYGWRWRSGQLQPRGLMLREWSGQDLEPADRVLVSSEQGLGDALQFCRYAPILEAKYGCAVFVEVRHPLVRLMKTLEGISGVVTFGEALPEGLTHHVSMMSLPGLLGTMSEEDIPAQHSYLSADPHRAALFHEHLTALPPVLRVGVCWAGQHRAGNRAAAAVDAARSTTLAAFAPAARVRGVSWVSLQKGPPAAQAPRPPQGMTLGDWTEHLDDFYDTAALISCLDLVVTVDTSVAHVAAALGVPTWVLSRSDPCWRWMGHREDSPWYPTVRHFAQPEAGDWEGVMGRVAMELEKMVPTASARAA